MKFSSIILATLLTAGACDSAFASDVRDLPPQSIRALEQLVELGGPDTVASRMAKLFAASAQRVIIKQIPVEDKEILRKTTGTLKNLLLPLRPQMVELNLAHLPRTPQQQLDWVRSVLNLATTFAGTMAPILGEANDNNARDLDLFKRILPRLEKLAGCPFDPNIRESAEDTPQLKAFYEAQQGADQPGQERGTFLLARLTKIINRMNELILKPNTPRQTVEKYAKIAGGIMQATERYDATAKSSKDVQINDIPASIAMMTKSAEQLMEDCRAFAVKFAPQLGITATGSGEAFERKLLYRVLKNLEEMLEEPTAPKYQEPAPGTQDAEGPTTNPYEAKPHEYEPQQPAKPTTAPTPDPSDVELAPYEQTIVDLSNRLVNVGTQLALRVQLERVAPQKMELCKWLVDYIMAKNTEVAEQVKPGHRGPILPGTLTEAELAKVRTISRQHMVQLGQDIAPKLGLEVIEMTLPQKIKLSCKVIERLEKFMRELNQ